MSLCRVISASLDAELKKASQRWRLLTESAAERRAGVCIHEWYRWTVRCVLDSAAMDAADTKERGKRSKEAIRGGDRTLDLERVKLAS